MFITLFKMLHEKVMSISLFSDLLLFDCTILPQLTVFPAAMFYIYIYIYIYIYSTDSLFPSPLRYRNVVLALPQRSTLYSTYSTLCVCLGNGASVTRHISLMELQSLLLSLYASQASVCSRSNSSFVTLKLTSRGWDFYSSNLQSAFQTTRFTGSLEMFCWNLSMM